MPRKALENANNISEGICSVLLKVTLEANLPSAGKKPKRKVTLGVADKNLASSIKDFFPNFEYETGDTSEVVGDLLRGLRQHAPKLLKRLGEVSFSCMKR
jgi:nucleolar protein 56